MFVFPNINPVAIAIGPVQVHWYGLMYLLGFLMAWGLGLWRIKRFNLPWTAQEVGDLIFYAALGVIIGGRLGYMLFYNTHALLYSPLSTLKVWEGGMSFHGGLIGVSIAMLIFAYMHKKRFFAVTDFITPLVPLGLAAGRAGNFINGELWGRVTTVPWAIIFPHVDMQPRHPSQLYELLLEGLLLFIIVWWYASKPRALGRVTAMFLISYACIRIFVEFFRDPDLQVGFVALDWVTMGQLLSLPMLLIGLILMWIKRNANIS